MAISAKSLNRSDVTLREREEIDALKEALYEATENHTESCWNLGEAVYNLSKYRTKTGKQVFQIDPVGGHFAKNWDDYLKLHFKKGWQSAKNYAEVYNFYAIMNPSLEKEARECSFTALLELQRSYVKGDFNLNVCLKEIRDNKVTLADVKHAKRLRAEEVRKGRKRGNPGGIVASLARARANGLGAQVIWGRKGKLSVTFVCAYETQMNILRKAASAGNGRSAFDNFIRIVQTGLHGGNISAAAE